MSNSYGCSETHAQQPGINRVPHKLIGPVLDQLMLLLQGNGPAPVTAESYSCPKAEEEAGETEDGADAGTNLGAWNDNRVEGIWTFVPFGQ